MSLSYIIDQVCLECGYNPTNDRTLLLRLINRACQEVYKSTDLPGSLREVTVLAEPNSIVALPNYVGELRSARNHFSLARLTITEMAPKYNFNPWPQLWNNWRVLRKSPIKTCIVNSAIPIFMTMEEADTVAVTVTVTGATTKSSRVSEIAVLEIGETETQLTQQFIEIESITKDVINNNDITLTGGDADENEIELAVIPNDKLNSLYTIVDVSKLPLGGDVGSQFHYIDVLYKSPLPWLGVDGDEFICQGYDDAIVAKVCEYYYAKQADGSAKAVEYYAKCKQIIADSILHTNGATEKELVFAPNGLLGIYNRFNYAGGFRRLGISR